MKLTDQIAVRFEPHDAEAISHIARVEDRPRAAVVRRLVRKALAVQQQEAEEPAT